MQENKKKTSNKAPVVPIVILSILLAATIGVLIFIWVRFGSPPSQDQIPKDMDIYAMDVVVSQSVYGDHADTAMEEAAKAINELDDLLAWQNETSDIAKINTAAGGTPVTVDSRTIAVLKTALEVARKTDGVFDPTILPVSSLWHFDNTAPQLPSTEEVAKFLLDVGYENLSIDEANSTVTLAKTENALDLGAIGKGAACDAAIEAYRKAGVERGIISVGGSSIGTLGEKASGEAWNIEVQNPNSKHDNIAFLGILSIKEGFVSTSGTYIKTFEQDGVTYHHILNPKTGYPAQGDLVSVTVTCDNGALSDALSTACLSLGIEDAKKLLAEYHAGGIFVDKENRVIVTDNLKDSFQLTAEGFTLA